MNELRQRKHHRLSGYDCRHPGYYFITICTKDKAHTLGHIPVGADVLIGPHTVLSKTGCVVRDVILTMPSVDHYVIMPNHIHLILHLPAVEGGPMGTSAPTVPMLVRYLNRSVTLACGNPVWQDDYYDHVIRSEADYLRIWEYIDTNPAKWQDDCYYSEQSAAL